MAGQILLVDSEPNRVRLLQRRLARGGFEVVCAESLEHAAEAEGLPPLVVIVDLALVCGPDRGRLESVLSRAAGMVSWHCETCGRRLVELTPGAAPPWCCGQAMVGLPAADAGERIRDHVA